MIPCLGELSDDSTLPSTVSSINLEVWHSAALGNGVTSYHCWLLARDNRIAKEADIAQENEEELTDLEQYARWMGVAWFLDRDIDSHLLSSEGLPG